MKKVNKINYFLDYLDRKIEIYEQRRYRNGLNILREVKLFYSLLQKPLATTMEKLIGALLYVILGLAIWCLVMLIGAYL